MDSSLAALFARVAVPEAEGEPSPLGALVHQPAVRSRNAVRYLTVRRWQAHAKAADLDRLKAAKRAPVIDRALAAGAAAEIADVAGALLGCLQGWCVTAVATGHSRRPDAFARQVAEAVARCLRRPFVQVFEDRYTSGVSHPKENLSLPPLVVRARPAGPVLLVDDVATSGWHREEAATAIAAVLPVAWIGGTVKEA